VAMRRGRAFRNVKLFVEEGPKQKVNDDGIITTLNVVYLEVL